MYLAEQDRLVLSPSDLNAYVSCPHLTTLELARVRGEIEDDRVRGAEAELLAQKGDEHEQAYLEQLKAEGRKVVEIPPSDDQSADSMRAAAQRTEEAMRAGADVIFQGTFFDEIEVDGELLSFRGHTDFLLKVDNPSDLGAWSYEVADTKLAKRAKPYFILQLCFYSELLERVQGHEPERIHVILGDADKTTESYRLAEFSSYFRRVRSRFVQALAADSDTYPEPCDHCGVCGWRERCEAQREEDDHLSLVAGIRTAQRQKLVASGIATVEALGSLPEGEELAGISPETLEKIREQAELQVAARVNGSDGPPMRLLTPESGRGFHRMPKPSPGDLFFDIEGDPFYEGGLEYLFGVVSLEEGEGSSAEPHFEAIWGTDRAMEKSAVEQFIDLVVERRMRWQDLRIYHYNHYEVTALKRLVASHGTREEELDQLLRDEVFVDLLKVVREGFRVGLPGYGLKKIETLFMEDERDTEVSDGGASVVEFERWLEGGRKDDSILAAIAEYNEDDCIVTLRLRDWLLGLRERAAEEHGVEIPWFVKEEKEDSDAAKQARAEAEGPQAALQEALLADWPEDPAEADHDQRARWLLAQLLSYHRREERPIWWAFFDRLDRDPADLVDDVDCIGGLRTIDGFEPEPDKRSEKRMLRFPPQETKVSGGKLVDPVAAADGLSGVTVLSIDDAAGRIEVKRGPAHGGRPWPTALIPGGPYRTTEQRAALARLAEKVLRIGLDGDGRYGAARDLLMRRHPRVHGMAEGTPLHGTPATTDELQSVVRGLDSSYLMIQGPPGAGKTHSGARLIVDLIDRGKRVGVTSTSHRSIHNLLEEVEKYAAETGVKFRGLKKSTGSGESEFASKIGMIESLDDNTALTSPDVALAAGTAWHFCREEVDGTLDYLFIDEAGQISLADALALSTAARNVVLLGDPQQLPQVSQGRHPEGADASVLEHLLGDMQTIPSERGVFLGETYRMCPEIAEFVSDLMYDGRLGSAAGRDLQRIVGGGRFEGSGLRYLPIEHDSNVQRSEEEAKAIAEAVEELLEGGRYIDCDGIEHELKLDDILVVAPFNAQVKCLADHLPDGARVGTVDKFQGQTAQVVFFSMAASSGESVPRGLEFLFSRNRLNVAMSRARCLAVLICAPALPDASCKTIEQMRLVNVVCRLVEGT